MIRTRILTSAIALACGFTLALGHAQAKSTDYRFELVGQPQASGTKEIVQVRLVHVADNKPVPNVVIFESTADMGPEGMPMMPSPIEPLPPQGDIYSFAVEPTMTGTWALRLAAKVQGEPETVRGTVNANLVK